MSPAIDFSRFFARMSERRPWSSWRVVRSASRQANRAEVNVLHDLGDLDGEAASPYGEPEVRSLRALPLRGGGVPGADEARERLLGELVILASGAHGDPSNALGLRRTHSPV